MSKPTAHAEVKILDLTPPERKREIEAQLARFDELAPDGFLLIDPKRHLYAVLMNSPAHQRVRAHSMGEGPTYSGLLSPRVFEERTFLEYYLPPIFFEVTSEP